MQLLNAEQQLFRNVCGTKCDPKVAYEFLKRKFNSKKASFSELKRGIIDRETLKLAEQPFEVAEQFEG